MQVTIKPHSSIQKYFIGDAICISLNKYSDLLDYLVAMQPKFMLYTKEIIAEGMQESFIFLDENLREITADDLKIKRFTKDTTIHIVPTIYGGGGKRGGLLAILASVALFAFAGPLATALSPTLGVKAGVIQAKITSLALSLAINGVASLLMKTPSGPKTDEGNRIENNMFSSLRNTIDSGTFIAINYGQVRVGGQLVSGYIKTLNHDKGVNVRVSDVIGFDSILYDPVQASQAGVLTAPNTTSLISQDGLIMYIDAGSPASYSGIGTTVTDLISGQEGTLVGNVTFDNFSFKWDSGYIDMNNTYISDTLINTTDKKYTIDTWMKVDNVSSNANVVTNSVLGIAVTPGYELITRRARDEVLIESEKYFPIFEPINIEPSSNPAPQGRWNHIAFSWAGDSGSMYINGVLSNTTVDSTTLSGASNLFIGSNTGLNQSKTALVRLYNRALSAEDIQKNFKSEKARFGV